MSEKPKFVNASDYLALPRDPDVWLLKNLFPASGSGILYAPPKVGKTFLAMQMADAIAGNGDTFMDFDVVKRGRVLMLQLDTPRTTFAPRFEAMRKHGCKFDDQNVWVADNESIGLAMVDILNPNHQQMLKEMIQPLQPTLVIIDTLRKLHTGDENSSNDMSNVMSLIKTVTYPSAVLMISHERKPMPDGEKDIMNDLRGSTSVVGEMDAILRLTKHRLYFAGRNIEADSIKLVKQDVEGCMMWAPDLEDVRAALLMVLNDPKLKDASLREKARVLAKITNKSEGGSLQRIRRHLGLA